MGKRLCNLLGRMLKDLRGPVCKSTWFGQLSKIPSDGSQGCTTVTSTWAGHVWQRVPKKNQVHKEKALTIHYCTLKRSLEITSAKEQKGVFKALRKPVESAWLDIVVIDLVVPEGNSRPLNFLDCGPDTTVFIDKFAGRFKAPAKQFDSNRLTTASQWISFKCLQSINCQAGHRTRTGILPRYVPAWETWNVPTYWVRQCA